MKRLLNVMGGLLSLLVIAVLAIASILFFRGQQGRLEVVSGVFQSPPGTPTQAARPTKPPIFTKPAGTPVPPSPTPSFEPYPPPVTVMPWPSPTPTITPPAWPPITEPIRIVEYIQLTTEDSGLPTWSPDGGKIAFVKSSGRAIETEEAWLPISEVWVMNADGTNVEKLADNGIWPVWSPDGQRIAYVSTITVGQGELWIANVNGQGRRKLADIDFKPIQWVSSGRIAFVQQGRAMLVREDGIDPRSLELDIPAVPVRRGFELSPDGSRLAFWSKGRFQVMGFMNGQLSTITDVPVQILGRSLPALAWSPDGQKLAYIAGRSGAQPELWVMNADGTGHFLLLRGQQEVFDHLTWSPDGRYIAFSHSATGSNMPGALQIYLVKATGSQPLNLTPNYQGGVSLAWSPDGTRIALVRLDVEARGTIWVAMLQYTVQ